LTEPNNWTFKTLQEHLISIMDERDRLYDQRFTAQEKAVATAMVSAKEAVAKAEAAVERRLENTNEWRQVINDLVKAQQGSAGGIKASWGVALALISLAIAAFALLK